MEFSDFQSLSERPRIRRGDGVNRGEGAFLFKTQDIKRWLVSLMEIISSHLISASLMKSVSSVFIFVSY